MAQDDLWGALAVLVASPLALVGLTVTGGYFPRERVGAVVVAMLCLLALETQIAWTAGKARARNLRAQRAVEAWVAQHGPYEGLALPGRSDLEHWLWRRWELAFVDAAAASPYRAHLLMQERVDRYFLPKSG